MNLFDALRKKDKKKTFYLGSKPIVTVMEKDIKEEGYIKFSPYGLGYISESYFIRSPTRTNCFFCEWHTENLPDFDHNFPIAIEYNDTAIHTMMYNYNPYCKLNSRYIEHYNNEGTRIKEIFYYEENQEIAAGTYYPLIPHEISYPHEDRSIADVIFLLNPVIHRGLYNYLADNYAHLIEINKINKKLFIKKNELANLLNNYGISLEKWDSLPPGDIKLIRILSYKKNYEGMFKTLEIDNIFEASKEKINLLKMLII